MWGLLVALIFILIIALFSVQNAQLVTFSYIFGKIRLPLALIIVCSALIGAILSTFASVARRYQLLKDITEHKLRIKELEEQIERSQKELGKIEEKGE